MFVFSFRTNYANNCHKISVINNIRTSNVFSSDQVYKLLVISRYSRITERSIIKACYDSSGLLKTIIFSMYSVNNSDPRRLIKSSRTVCDLNLLCTVVFNKVLHSVVYLFYKLFNVFRYKWPIACYGTTSLHICIYVKKALIRATHTCHMQHNIVLANQNPYTRYGCYDSRN